ncbi:MAG: hypothetical protein D6731_25135 [Planctomycetota bacterium]|nr:MAG: hypothetical protein D6731_25135 [Planctomycetota bacterium]
MHSVLLRGLCALALVFGLGCADLRVGVHFDPARAAEIQPKRTTRAEVRALLGPPLRSLSAGDVVIDVHKWVTPSEFACVYVSYRGDEVMHVTRVP